jgi:hypothetical protein
MEGVMSWLITLKPLWFLAAWLASSVFGAFVALEKNRCGLCWFAMGILFGPLALIATAGLPVKPPRLPAGRKPGVPEAAHPHVPAHGPVHAPLAHGPAHGPGHAPAHSPSPAPAHGPAHATLGHASAAHPAPPAGVYPPPLSPVHPAAPHVAHAAAHPANGHHAEPAHAPVKTGFFASAMDRPAAGVAIAAVVVLLLLIYFGSLHL